MIQTTLGYEDSVMSSLLGETGLIISEIFVNVAFSLFALLLITLPKNKNLKIYSGVLGMSRVILSGSMLASYWKPGWYFILDPVDTHTNVVFRCGASLGFFLEFWVDKGGR